MFPLERLQVVIVLKQGPITHQRRLARNTDITGHHKLTSLTVPSEATATQQSAEHSVIGHQVTGDQVVGGPGHKVMGDQVMGGPNDGWTRSPDDGWTR